MNKFAVYIKKLRKKRGYSQKGLGLLISRSDGWVSKLENTPEAIRNISIDEVRQLSLVLKVRSTKLARIALKSIG